jgi:hypothetical protein
VKHSNPRSPAPNLLTPLVHIAYLILQTMLNMYSLYVEFIENDGDDDQGNDHGDDHGDDNHHQDLFDVTKSFLIITSESVLLCQYFHHIIERQGKGPSPSTASPGSHASQSSGEKDKIPFFVLNMFYLAWIGVILAVVMSKPEGEFLFTHTIAAIIGLIFVAFILSILSTALSSPWTSLHFSRFLYFPWIVLSVLKGIKVLFFLESKFGYLNGINFLIAFFGYGCLMLLWNLVDVKKTSQLVILCGLHIILTMVIISSNVASEIEHVSHEENSQGTYTAHVIYSYVESFAEETFLFELFGPILKLFEGSEEEVIHEGSEDEPQPRSPQTSGLLAE